MENKNITKIIKELRSRLGLTQEQLAQKVGVTFVTMHNWEKGHRRPHPFLLKRILNMANKYGLKIKQTNVNKKARVISCGNFSE